MTLKSDEKFEEKLTPLSLTVNQLSVSDNISITFQCCVTGILPYYYREFL